MTPEKLLWSAAIAQAVRDARGEGCAATGALPWPGYDAKEEALEWIFGKDTGFEQSPRQPPDPAHPGRRG